MKMSLSLMTLGALAAVATTGATAGPVAGIHAPANSMHPPAIYEANGRSGNLLNEWRFRRDWQDGAWQGPNNSYAAALAFAACVVKFDPDSTALVGRQIGSSGDREALVNLVKRNRGCIGEYGAVAPLLLRVALAEIQLRTSQGWGRAINPQPLSVGVPEAVDNYPLASISRCQVHVSPDLAEALLKTRPGTAEERDAATALFRESAICGASDLGGVAPTVARLAVVDAAYRRIVR